jgi:hypothetical protein
MDPQIPAFKFQSGGMENLIHRNQNDLFFERLESCLFELIGIPGDNFEVLLETVRSVRVDDRNPILEFQACLREITAIKRPVDRATTKRYR